MVDSANITIRSGKGGDGAALFLRAKYVPKGGPSGGDGGDGGSIIFRSVNKLNTLSQFRYKKSFKADNGQNGMRDQKSGKSATDLIIEVPCGTLIYNNDTNFLIADLTDNNKEILVAKGGKGGLGNVHFKSSRNQAPTQFTKGEDSEKIDIRLELKLLANIGLIGLPSAGKSTLLNSLTGSNAKTAEYHFTTLEPNLGVLYNKRYLKSPINQELVLADIPGLIEGASEGKGLGHDFLKHIERTSLLVHILALSGSFSIKNLLNDYHVIRNELKSWKSDLSKKDEILVINKIDLIDDTSIFEAIRKEFQSNFNKTPLFISAYNQENLIELVGAIDKNFKGFEFKSLDKLIKAPLNFTIKNLPNKRIIFDR